MIKFRQINTDLSKLLYLMFFCSGFGFGQNNLSFSNDQYSGINSAPLSPTTPYFNPNKWDVSIFFTDILFQNDYAYIGNSSDIDHPIPI